MNKTITLAHGSGGRATHELVDTVFRSAFDNPLLNTLEDQARIDLATLQQHGNRLAFTTDSYVVDPLFFAGGDIGSLAVHGTVNDLAVSGARPLYLSCAVIIEEGLSLDVLQRVAQSMARAAGEAGVQIVTGDTKVVPHGAADKLFINTSGIGVIPAARQIAARHAMPGDRVLVSGPLGDHGVAILAARAELALDTPVHSDSQPLNGLIEALLEACPGVHCLRDATRGGLATVLNEFAQAANVGIHIEGQAIPVRPEVRGASELLGLDPLYFANEGRIAIIVPAESTDRALAALRHHPAGEQAAVIGEVREIPRGRVVLHTGFGGQRALEMLVGEQLPRIC